MMVSKLQWETHIPEKEQTFKKKVKFLILLKRKLNILRYYTLIKVRHCFKVNVDFYKEKKIQRLKCIYKLHFRLYKGCTK